MQQSKVGEIAFRDIPVIAEIEAMMDIRGVEWRADFERKVDAASIALFGITRADTIPPEPHPDQYSDGTRLSQYMFKKEDASRYEQALEAWHQWQDRFKLHDQLVAASNEPGVSMTAIGNVDVTGADGRPLRCLKYFSRQLFVVAEGYMPKARFTPDGTSARATQTPEEWGAALAASAAKFKPRRR